MSIPRCFERRMNPLNWAKSEIILKTDQKTIKHIEDRRITIGERTWLRRSVRREVEDDETDKSEDGDEVNKLLSVLMRRRLQR